MPPLVPRNQFQLYTCDVPPSCSWLGTRTRPGMDWLLCRGPLRKAESQLHSWLALGQGRCLYTPTYLYPGYLFRNTWASYPKPLDPIPYGQYIRVSAFQRLLTCVQ